MEEEGIPLLSCEFSFSQEVDERGMPISIVKSGTIDLTLASMDDEELVSWAMGSEDKNGKIVFSGIESTRAFKTLKFDFGHCVKYHERFTRDAEMVIDLSISAMIVTVGNSSHGIIWPGYTPPSSYDAPFSD